jgi:glycosyltransferase involved in cell wall biosynthesis
MSIVIFGDLFSFPEGQAATNRVYTYAKGFKENGVNVHVMVYSSTYNEVHKGVVEGIEYSYPFEQKKRSNSFFVRRWQKAKKIVRTYRTLKRLNKKDKIIAINSWTCLMSTHITVWMMAKLLNAKLITEVNEHPLKYYQGGGAVKKRLGNIQFYFESRLCNGILCISRYLVEFHKRKGVNEKKLFLIPSTVDISRFEHKGNRPYPGPYIGYFGSLTFKRDNVDALVKGFAKFSKVNPNVQLVLGGFCTGETKKQLNDLVAECGVTGRVILLDFLSRQEILDYISHADVLVMVRSRDMESDASYPSKLAEFLATGNPVVSVKVGEVSDYLTDNENAFLVEPGDHEAMAGKFSSIFNNYEHAGQVGQKGKELANSVFNYKNQVKRLLEFIKS